MPPLESTVETWSYRWLSDNNRIAVSPRVPEKRKCSNKKRTRIIHDLVIVLYANDNIKGTVREYGTPIPRPGHFFGCDLKTIRTGTSIYIRYLVHTTVQYEYQQGGGVRNCTVLVLYEYCCTSTVRVQYRARWACAAIYKVWESRNVLNTKYVQPSYMCSHHICAIQNMCSHHMHAAGGVSDLDGCRTSTSSPL